MSYRKWKADRIHDGKRFLPAGSVVVTDREGRILEVVGEAEGGSDTEILEGILLPGWINCHCHLELSHMKGVIPAGKGLVDFLLSVIRERKVERENKTAAIIAGETELWANGTAGVADICNTTDALPAKKGGRMHWHNLVEVLNFFDSDLEGRLDYFSSVLQAHEGSGSGTLTPHAPYTVSSGTFAAINRQTAGGIISVHNQETGAEDELFRSGTGEFLRLYGPVSGGISPFPVSGKGSLSTWLPHFTEGQTILLVHNTYIKEADILFAAEHAAAYGLKLVYCLCPNANLYIENRLPPVELLHRHGCSLVLGTDSYCSNNQLSIASEVQAIRAHFGQLPLETVLQWATSNGALALGWDKELGRIEKGKKPGLALLQESDFSVKRLI